MYSISSYLWPKTEHIVFSIELTALKQTVTIDGYRIVNAHFTGLLHEVGKSKKYHILGFEFAVNNH